jgi:hypothetical protein
LLENLFMKKEIDLCVKPIFIIGSPRSGTTALAWSLAQHSHLWTSEESDILFDLLGWGHVDKAFHAARGRPGEIDWLVVNSVERAEFLGYLGLGLNAMVASRSQGKRWIDQTPRNTLFLDVVMDLFPDACFLHILRDGCRVVQSMLHFFDPRGDQLREAYVRTGRLPTWVTDFRAGCKEWAKFVELSLWYAERYPDRFLTVQNEKLMADPGHEFQQIFDFIQVPFEKGPVEFFQTKRINSSFPQHYGPNGAPTATADHPWDSWSEEQRDIFLQEAGDVYLQCGYSTKSEFQPSDYQRSIFRLRDTVRTALPPSARILVISDKDDLLLNLPGRFTWHFPRTEEGFHAGNPKDSGQAIAHLEEARRRGGQYLLIPRTALWWFDHYNEFRDYLTVRYSLVVATDECLIFSITAPTAPAESQQATTDPQLSTLT